eukprot:364220-Chlamydomonas_euryale.AAC.1
MGAGALAAAETCNFRAGVRVPPHADWCVRVLGVDPPPASRRRQAWPSWRSARAAIITSSPAGPRANRRALHRAAPRQPRLSSRRPHPAASPGKHGGQPPLLSATAAHGRLLLGVAASSTGRGRRRRPPSHSLHSGAQPGPPAGWSTQPGGRGCSRRADGRCAGRGGASVPPRRQRQAASHRV